MFSTTAWDDTGPEALLLSPLSVLYAAGWIGYQSIYRLGLKKPAQPHTPVVCVGSLLAGGAGKSPATVNVAEGLQSRGRRVAISISGYRSAHDGGATLAPPDKELDAREWGDETAMMRWMLPEVPLVVGRDRVRAAEIIHAEFPDFVMLMDSGFQHLPLKIDVSILLDPPALRNRLPLPAGPYREVRGMGRARADMVIPTPQKFVPHEYVDGLQRPDGAMLEEMPKTAAILTAIGRPNRVVAAIESLGIEVSGGHQLPDHDPLDRPNLFSEIDQSLPIIVTAKDWVKLRSRTDLPLDRILILRHRVSIEPREEFLDWLTGRLDAVA